MPAKVQVKVVAARDLPIMDRSSELTDAFVEVSARVVWVAGELTSLAAYWLDEKSPIKLLSHTHYGWSNRWGFAWGVW